MSSVTVRGTAAASVTPDRAELSLALTHLAADAAGALDEVAARSQQLEQMLAGHGFGAGDWATEGKSHGVSHRVGRSLAQQPRREGVGLADHEVAVEQRERLRRDR